MQFFHKIVNSSLLENIINLPIEMKNKDVEIILRPISKKDSAVENNTTLFGFLSNYQNDKMIENEKNAWEIAMKEKYGNR